MKETGNIAKLSHLQEEINQKISYLADLKEDYNEREEKMFLKTFVNIMDRMSNELLEQKRLYNHIDEQINRDPQCVKLQEKLNFYTQECLTLKQELQQTEQQLRECKQRNTNYAERNEKLHQNLYKESKKQRKYKYRASSLETRSKPVEERPEKSKYKTFYML